MLDNFALMIDGQNASDAKAVKSADVAFPEYPDQNATKLQLVAWHMKFKSDLTSSYNADPQALQGPEDTPAQAHTAPLHTTTRAGQA